MRTRDAQHGLDGPGLLLLPAAAIAVHQLRYWFAYGPRASAQLAAQGHSYLHSLVPWAIFALAAAGGLYLRRLATAARTDGAGDVRRRSAAGLWLATFAGLLVAYAAQESLEGALVTGHPAGWGGVFGHGGWWAVPAAALMAAVVAALLLLGGALLRHTATAATRRARHSPTLAVPTGARAAVVRPLARAAAGRAPPLRLLPR